MHDRTGLHDGPWMTEPDLLEFESQGYKCLLKRSPVSFTWCGYTVLPAGHPAYRKSSLDIDVSVHGGLTFAEESKEGWVVGFDMAHWLDLAPGLIRSWESVSAVPYPGLEKSHYKDIEYAKEQTLHLAKQLKEMEGERI